MSFALGSTSNINIKEIYEELKTLTINMTYSIEETFNKFCQTHKEEQVRLLKLKHYNLGCLAVIKYNVDTIMQRLRSMCEAMNCHWRNSEHMKQENLPLNSNNYQNKNSRESIR